MARTVINVSGIMNSSSKGNSAKNIVAGVETGINSTKSQIDVKIINRNNIGSRLNTVMNQVDQIEAQIATICASINSATIKYQNAEMKVMGYGQQIGKVASQNTSGGNRGKYEALFAEAAIEDLTLKMAAGAFAYKKADKQLTLFGAEYENNLIHMFDEEELAVYFAKFETENSESYFNKYSISEERSLNAGYEFDTERFEDWINGKKKEGEEDNKETNKVKEIDKEIYFDESGNEVSKDDAPKYYDRKATIAELDKTVGVSHSLYEGTFSTGGDGDEVKVTVGNAEAHAGISAGFYVVDNDGKKKFSPGVKAEIGTSATALEVTWDQQWFGDENLGLNTGVTATVGKAETAADITAQIFGENGELDVQLGASASAEAIGGEIEGSIGVNVLGGEVSVTGGLNYGIGAHADVGYRDGVFKCDVSASLGVGASLDIEVDIGGMVDTVSDGIFEIVDNAGALWDGVKNGWNDIWKW